jgi:primosomal protein N' (replication factor Y) (superfamily II helicase)
MSGQESLVRVALPLPVPQLFDYLASPGMAAAADWIGRRVRVPFGRKRLVGVVVAVEPRDAAGRELKSIEALLDAEPLFTTELWQTLTWASGYYHRALGEVLGTALPLGLRAGAPLPDLRRRAWALTPTAHGEPPPRVGSRPRAVHELLAHGPLAEEQLDASLPGWRDAMRRLARRGLVELVHLTAPAPAATRSAPPVLNSAQQHAAESIIASLGGFRCLLLDGVTGSGKTEVYLAAIDACLARGRQALVLVPEIGLTPQALRRYGERLAVPVQALHSGLSEGERLQAWCAMAGGEARVLIGTRSAVFAPLPEAGLIIVDEEHDASYKQQEGFRYHARDLALVRAKALGIPVVLGSATPSLESLSNARQGRYAALRLAQRAGAARPPSFHVLDVRSLPLRDGLSAPLLAALGQCLARGEQALVFRNRRGYAPCLLCHDCGWSAQCPRCDTALTLHGRRRLLCHHCGARRATPDACPQCQGLGLVPQGVGTERLERALAESFPQTTLIRVDRETTQHRDALERHFEALGDGPGILVGTQMLAKGHDLPGLTLVAIADIDEGLFSADFRASERMAQLLVQVAGRAGRAQRPGSVWLQTHHPQHALLQTLLHGGYPAFADAALAEREAAAFPPFAHLALLRAEAPEQEDLDSFLQASRRCLPPEPTVTAFPPMPAPMPRRAGRHRGQLLVSAPARGALQAMLRPWMAQLHALREARRVRWALDVDPTDLY